MLGELIGTRRAAVADRWRERILTSYPDQTGRFLTREPDRFANPVGHALKEVTAAAVAALADGRPPEDVGLPLDEMVHIRAVQDQSAARAVEFVLELKPAVRDVLGAELEAAAARAELERVDAWVDRLLLVAFELHSRCREQLFQIRVNEIRNRSLKAMERLNDWRERRAAAHRPSEPGSDP